MFDCKKSQYLDSSFLIENVPPDTLDNSEDSHVPFHHLV
jgi:hypothetical protein